MPKPTNPREERKLAPEVEADSRSVVEANNRFALDLYSRQRTQPGNLFLSPYSISTAFGMLWAGAAGKTEEEMASVLHFSLPQERLHPAFGALQRSLDRGIQLGGYELRIANRVVAQKGYPFRQAFLDLLRQDYGTEVQEADFVTEPDAARQSVNVWVEEQTNSKIRDLFPPGSIGPLTRLVLANAIYFKGLWAKPFDKQKTADAPFHVNGDSAVLSVPTMSQEDRFKMAESVDVQVLELPYRGEDLSMLILLPRRINGLADLEAKLSTDGLGEWERGLAERRVVVSLPRFKFSSKFGLPQLLVEMGMPSAFLADRADFSGIDGQRDLFVSAAFHQAFVVVDEEGTEAAAATGIGMEMTSAPPSFIADHPFLFLIRDNVTGSILFLGRVADPRT